MTAVLQFAHFQVSLHQNSLNCNSQNYQVVSKVLRCPLVIDCIYCPSGLGGWGLGSPYEQPSQGYVTSCRKKTFSFVNNNY